MGGSARKPQKPQPSYMEGKPRDLQLREALERPEQAETRDLLFRIIRRAGHPRGASGQ